MATQGSSATRVTRVAVSPLVLFKILKHARERVPPIVGGSLVGLYTPDGVLEITNCFPKLSGPPDDQEEAASLSENDTKDLQTDMLLHLQKHRLDDLPVGWYSTHSTSAFLLKQSSVLDQMRYQEDFDDKCVVLVFDPQRFDQSLPAFRAFRLTQQMMDMAPKLQERDIVRADVWEELPVETKAHSLEAAFVAQLQQQVPADARRLGVHPAPFVESNMAFLVDTLDDYVDKYETFDWFRKKRAEIVDKRGAAIARRQQENKQREAQRLPPLGFDDIERSWRIPTLKYTRLERMLVPRAIDNYCDDLVSCAAASTGKLYVVEQEHS